MRVKVANEDKLRERHGRLTAYVYPCKSTEYLGIRGHHRILVMKDGKLADSEVARKWWERKVKKGVR